MTSSGIVEISKWNLCRLIFSKTRTFEKLFFFFFYKIVFLYSPPPDTDHFWYSFLFPLSAVILRGWEHLTSLMNVHRSVAVLVSKTQRGRDSSLFQWLSLLVWLRKHVTPANRSISDAARRHLQNVCPVSTALGSLHRFRRSLLWILSIRPFSIPAWAQSHWDLLGLELELWILFLQATITADNQLRSHCLFANQQQVL